MYKFTARFVIATSLTCLAAATSANAKPYEHVLLISVDGLHAVDLANYVSAHPQSEMAALQKSGLFYPNAVTTNPSDSFPGLVAQVTGGTPAVTGVYYDDSFDRSYFSAGSKCQGKPGIEVSFAESIDIDDTRLDAGGTPGKPMTQIDPAKLPRMLVSGECKPVFPHDFVRVNNIFEIVHQHGGRTAWSDKHPAYEWLNGPSGAGVDDLYALEQDSLIPGSKIKTTGSFKAERDFDEARVKAVINEIKGLDSTGANKQPVPALFGLNLQAVSVGQKLPKAGPGDEAGLIGGYADANGTPKNGLGVQLDYVDHALGELVGALRDNKLEETTLVVIASKHGQSPIDPSTFQPTDEDPYTKIPGYAFHIADDASLIWLKPEERAKSLAAATEYLRDQRKALGIGQLMTSNQVALAYQNPATDARAPDFIVTVNPGVVYTGGKKIAEHGGSNANDRNVALLLSNPSISARTVTALVQTTQVAPTILQALGYDPKELQSVEKEATQALPGISF
ncbi:alkaline phosphatase family protein [Oryzifoliimicrobium ureilyticus]|uniref:alkaline phosphatase family protein n=1 Tax=Oryzifoliimicrobium ureilyticus TaxID=3113724 RepID=UPI0030760309